MTAEPHAGLPYRPNVGVTLINPQGLIWAGRRIDSAAPAWQMPQGGIDRGETAAQAALRELEEETGIGPALVEYLACTEAPVRYDLPPELIGKIWKGRFRGQEQDWFLYRFLGSDDQVNIVTDHPEFSEWRWLGAGEILDAIVPFKRAVYQEVIRAFRPWLAP
ncbi:RNA pyrophosphohydrolase [Defluviimonas sp. 20V17]|uniref:RNA pyrophosphohydrolase n=1 Tax=Allgaiera indica TaxID=765699 RepID=A0AAN4UML2_9RHOB|nr:RNA pyrophosphohydrolase [Allgaiera indica]KDB03662.1 RNA pyrophosphohydrolase [Defluviimonas sp. 20V17]GHD98186.1 RNA pyrophosphohydrolase [Allgaiera indica]SDW52093.1 putative (di)nucleoside polyphosphate hydrolase [Allgaiera indica]